MDTRRVIWTPSVREKLLQYRSQHFTVQETFEFILKLILEVEEFLKNDVIGKMYTEEFGEYKGFSRIIVKKFCVYYREDKNNIIILAISFPGEH